MYKELIISGIIITAIIIANIITQNNTNSAAEEISKKLTNFREVIIKEEVDNNKASQQFEEIESLWEGEYEKLAYYIEHDELEKVETELTKLKADIEIKNYEMAVKNLDNCMFILEHIKDKSALKIVNVF